MPDPSRHIRPARLDDADGIARVRVDTWQTTYRGIVPEPFLTSMSYAHDAERWKRILADPESNPSRIAIVAETEQEGRNKIIGFASGGPERDGNTTIDGELYALYLLKEYQGRGIGGALVREFIDRMRKKGFRSTLVWVLTDNPTRYFYEHMGGTELHRKMINLGGRELEEIAYKLEL